MQLFKAATVWLAAGIIFNTSLLFYFKYFNFFFDNINKLFGTEVILRNIILPLGISFFTFQQIAFMIDSYKRVMKPYPFWDYALFAAFFPQLVAGPIEEKMLPQFQNKEKIVVYRFSMEYFMQFENVQLYYFQDMEGIISNLDNYCDLCHHTPEINRHIFEDIRDGKNRLSWDNYKEVLDKMYQLAQNYDYYSL